MPRRIAAALGVVALLSVACGREDTGGGTSGPAPITAVAALERFDGCAELTQTLREGTAPFVSAWGLPGSAFGRAFGGPIPLTATDDRVAAEAAAPAEGTDFSGTNVQEAGVDEPDTVETDGRHIFAVAAERIHAVTVGGEARHVGSLALEGFGHQLLLDGDRLVVIGSDVTEGPRPLPMPEPAADIAIMPVVPDRTVVRIVDVSDPAAMRVVSTVRLDGSYIAARSVDGVVRIVLRLYEPRIDLVQPSGDSPAAARRALERNRDAVSSATAEQWIGRFEVDGGPSGALSSCESTYIPPGFSGPGTITVTTIDPADPTPREGATVVGGGDIVYASRDALYVTSQRWGDPRPLEDADAPVSSIDVVEPGTTEVHRFDIRGERAEYVASGAVRGTLLSQWSMSEHEGHLRVASTAGPTFATREGELPASESFVTVLAQRGDRLEQVGSVGGLGRGERIYAVRFIGAVGYVVTFRQVDPLYTLDLADPARPRVVGELKIPGYSAYLHPVGEGLILGVGQEATEEGRVLGTQVSLFDVSDAASPRRVGQLVIGAGSSGAEWDHHAFLWWEPRRLAVLPVQLYDFDRPVVSEGDGSFSGAVAIRVDGRVDEIGRISHPAAVVEGGVERYVAPISRSLVAGGALFTISETGIMQSDLGSLERRAWVAFPGA